MSDEATRIEIISRPDGKFSFQIVISGHVHRFRSLFSTENEAQHEADKALQRILKETAEFRE